MDFVSSGTVLLIEDDASLRLLIERRLTRMSCKVVSVSSLEEATATVEKCKYDLALLGLGIHDSEGEKWLGNYASKMPCVVISGDDDQARALHLIGCGARDYLVKSAFVADQVEIVAHRVMREVQIEEALSENQLRLGEACVMAQLGTWAEDVNQGRFFWSAELDVLFEVDPSRSVADPSVLLDCVHPEDRVRVESLGERLRSKGEPYDASYRLLMSDGRVKHVRENAKVMTNGMGCPIRLLGTVQDLTEIVDMRSELSSYRHGVEKVIEVRTRELIKEKKEAEKKGAARLAFLSGMSHDLRSPLNAILGFAKIMQRDSLVVERHGSKLEAISKSGERLLELINEILEISKMRTGRVELQESPVELYDELEGVVERLRPIAEGKGLEFVLDFEKDVPMHVLGDAPRLRQVVVNLIDNAIRFTSKGRVSLTVSKKDEMLCLSVKDTGCGIPREECHRVFEPFYTVIGEGQAGSGLGLSVAREYVRMMGGTISCRSIFGSGSVFEVVIPCRVSQEPQFDKEERGKVVSLAKGEHARRVLVVEDHAETAECMVQWLSDVGFKVRSVNNGVDALAACEKEIPDVVLLDMKMPGMDGVEVAKRIHINPKYNSVRVVALTGRALTQDHKEMLRSGCCRVMVKPVDLDELLEVVGETLEVHYLREHHIPDVDVNFEDFGRLPADWCELFYESAQQLDTERCLELISEVSERQPGIAGKLKKMVEEFMFERLLAQMKSILKKDEES